MSAGKDAACISSWHLAASTSRSAFYCSDIETLGFIRLHVGGGAARAQARDRCELRGLPIGPP